jgi:hypothetical protein
MLGADYLLPVNPVLRYRTMPDELMVPAAEIPPQDIRPWAAALERLLRDRTHYQQLSSGSRSRALDYARNLNVLPFEAFLENVARTPRRRAGVVRQVQKAAISDERRRLLALRLKRASTHVAD